MKSKNSVTETNFLKSKMEWRIRKKNTIIEICMFDTASDFRVNASS